MFMEADNLSDNCTWLIWDFLQALLASNHFNLGPFQFQNEQEKVGEEKGCGDGGAMQQGTRPSQQPREGGRKRGGEREGAAREL